MPIKRVRFFISDQVQDVGCRGFIISEMIFAGFEKGAAINLADGRVEVRIEGEEKRIKEFIEELKKKLVLKYGNPIVEVSDAEYIPDTKMLDLMNIARAHFLTQVDEYVNIWDDMKKHTESIVKKLG